MVIEIQGHASSIEKKAKRLSLLRAKTVKEKIVAKGINPKRIKIKGWGNQKLLVKNEIIQEAKSEKEKIALHLKNQRVFFRITGWDFKE